MAKLIEAAEAVIAQTILAGASGSGRRMGSGALEQHGWKRSKTTSRGSDVYKHPDLNGHEIKVHSETKKWSHKQGDQVGNITTGEGNSALHKHLSDFHAMYAKKVKAGGPGSGRHKDSDKPHSPAVRKLLTRNGFTRRGSNADLATYRHETNGTVYSSPGGHWMHQDSSGKETIGIGSSTLSQHLQGPNS